MFSGILTALGTLLVVIAILYLTFISTKYLGRNMKLKMSSRYMKVVDQMTLGQDSSMAIVRIAGELYLIGIASSQVSILSKLNEDELEDYGQDNMTKVPDFRDIMERIGNRKK